ncbi:MAG TPA: hypothetical protein VKE98_20320 [Gemmataceae bacterium]|nr:hypothetical protein [Gemmataceae bacterium]
MAFTFDSTWWKKFFGAGGRGRKASRKVRTRPRFFVPWLELLEGRLAPAVLTVNTAIDETTPDNLLSLREAVNVVNTQSTAGLSATELTHVTGTLGDNDTIRFSSSLVGKTISLTLGEIAFDVDLSIRGPGASKLAISGNNASRIFDIGQDASAVSIAG